MKIPYGISNYKKLKEEGFVYVDKTMFLSMLENVGETLIYLRPGRFGKSLFTSMMYYYYDINSENLFETLFKDTYVYQNPTPNKNNYYILKFDFSGITTAGLEIEMVSREFKNKVINGIKRFLSIYDFQMEMNEEKTVVEILSDFLERFSSLKKEHKLYILIDEYDNFTNGILEGDARLFKSIVSETGFIKAFYAIIKEYIGLGVVDRFFATGICPITLNSMTSGFNIATDISTDIRFNSMVGLTHEEVKNLLSEYEEKDKIYEIMVENYDGYVFNKHLSEENRTFNATLVMYLLNHYDYFKKVPEKLYDNNITVNYGKIENLIKLQNNNFWQDLISELLKTGEIAGELRTGFNLNIDFDYNDVISLLYYFGYLTIKEEGVRGNINFKIPNEMMKITYNNYFLKLLKENNLVLDNKKLDESVLEIMNEGTINHVTNYISEILRLSDNRIFIKFDEKYIQMLYFGLLVGIKEFIIYSECPSKNGYIDIYIVGNKEYMSDNIAIELKYIKKNEYSESLLNSKKEEGIEQLKKYACDERLKITKKYLVLFVGNDIKVIESVL